MLSKISAYHGPREVTNSLLFNVHFELNFNRQPQRSPIRVIDTGITISAVANCGWMKMDNHGLVINMARNTYREG